jgi:transposase
VLYVGIDQHVKQLTVCVRDESGSVAQRLQVSTHPAKLRPFLENLQSQTCDQGGFVVILEVCGFNGWLIDWLKELKCHDIVVIRPEKASRRKTDRRDAARLSELLWINRGRLLNGEKVQGIRRITWATADEAENRQLTSMRHRLGQQKTRVINQITRILHKQNLIHQQPTKTFQTKAVQKWLRDLTLPAIDRLETNLLLDQWDQLEKQLDQVERELARRAEENTNATRLRTIPGCGAFTALAVASRIGSVERFPSGRSLANFFGLTPTCHSSGESGDRLGHITKEGSVIVRFLLGQLVTHVLRRDADLRAWQQKIKRRRGAKIAKVAVMRKLVTSIWHMLKHAEPYQMRSQRTEHESRGRQRVDAAFTTN